MAPTTLRLLPMEAHTVPSTDAEAGAAFALGGRGGALTATLTVAALTGTVTVRVETSPTSALGSWTTAGTSAAIAALGVSTIAVTIPAGARYVRAFVASVTAATLSLDLPAPFVSATADVADFSKEFRTFTDGFARLVALGEAVILRELLVIDERGDLVVDAATEAPGFNAAIKAAIVQQAEHEFRRHKLKLASDPSAMVTLRDFPPLAPGVMLGLRRFRTQAPVSIWRGR